MSPPAAVPLIGPIPPPMPLHPTPWTCSYSTGGTEVRDARDTFVATFDSHDVADLVVLLVNSEKGHPS